MMMKHYLPVIGLLIIVDIHVAGCANFSVNPFSAPSKKVAPSVLDVQKKAIIEAEQLLLDQNPKSALEQFDAYLTKYPLSTYTAQAQLGRGRSLEALGKTAEAIEVYRWVGEQARILSPQQAGMAYVRLSACYEILGDETRLQLALKDALSFGEVLPEDVRLVEIPTRQAASDLRRGEADAARKTLKKVEENLPAVNSESPGPVQDRQAELLLNMGTMTLTGLSSENYLPQLESFEALQRYLWRSFSLKRPPYSDAALLRMHEAYTQFANLAFNPPKVRSGMAVAVADRTRLELQRKWISRLLESIQNLRSFSEGKAFDKSLQFGKLLGQIETGGDKILRRGGSLTPLSQESKALNALKRDGSTAPQPLFDSEKARGEKSLPEKEPAENPAVDSADPNLKLNPSGATEAPALPNAPTPSIPETP